MKISDWSHKQAREAYYQALSAQMAGGRVQIMAGDGAILVEIPFPEDTASATEDGFVYYNLAEQEVRKIGDPKKFAVVTASGKTVAEGSIGLQNADMIIEEKDARLFPGTRWGMNEFSFLRQL